LHLFCTSLAVFLFFLSRSRDLLDLHSFPTRRSSDLCIPGWRRLPWSGPTISWTRWWRWISEHTCARPAAASRGRPDPEVGLRVGDRKSTRLNSSHVEISYAVFCLKKKKKTNMPRYIGQCSQGHGRAVWHCPHEEIPRSWRQNRSMYE